MSTLAPAESVTTSQVRVDPTRCKGYSVCSNLAPEVFALDEWGFAHVQDGTITVENRRLILKSVRGCPVKAVRILERGADGEWNVAREK
jgi:ferredoxin